ncbi:MAG: glycosyltransferase, partial [Acidimicrobiales bacterium]
MMMLDTSHSGLGVPVQIRTLHVGDRVRVKSRDEVLATLDASGRIDGLPFMPEMLAFAGRSFTVEAVVHRTCDTIKTTGTSGTTRRLERAVHLQGLRCDGSAHGGCEARCLIFWKDAWLEKPPASGPSHDRPDEPLETAATSDVPPVLAAATRRDGSTDDKPLYSCQATEMLRATSFVSARDPRMWIADVRSGNATARRAIAGLGLLALGKLRHATARLPRPLRIRSERLWPTLAATGEKRRYAPLDLQPGELVEVRSREELEAIIDPDHQRGPRFDPGMLSSCGTRARVLGRVDRMIDEKTGRMLKLRDCTLLEGMWCEGDRRALCRRKIYTFWRESWLRRVDDDTDSSAVRAAPVRSGDVAPGRRGDHLVERSPHVTEAVPAATPRVAAVVVTYNRRDVLRASLAGLLSQTRPLDEVIVVDNASSDGTAEMVTAELPSVRLIEMPHNTGPGGGYAEGLRTAVASGHDWVWVFNDDDVPDPDALAVMLDAVAEPPARTGIVGCGRRDATGRPNAIGTRWKHRHAPVPAPADVAGPPVALDVISFSASLVSSALVRAIGVPRADYFMMVEDLEYCLRARRAGWGVYVLPRPLTISLNLGSVGLAPPWRGYYQTRNQLAMTLEHRSVPELWWWAVRNARFCAGALRSGDRGGERVRLR